LLGEPVSASRSPTPATRPGSICATRSAAAATPKTPRSRAGFTPTYIADADEFWPAKASSPPVLALPSPALALGVIRNDVVARPLRRDNEVFAVTRTALNTTTAVQTILTALTAASLKQPEPARRP
jgi:hypothetical protein